MNTERQQFEAWAKASKITSTNIGFKKLKNSPNLYADAILQSYWSVWQASREALKAEEECTWIACGDCMPEDCETVIVTDGIEQGFMWFSNNKWDSWHPADAVSGEITHWQPLPTPPEKAP